MGSFMQNFEQLAPHELYALKEIRLYRRASDPTLALELVQRGLVSEIGDESLHLTRKGRSLLVSGSGMLWDLAS